MTPLLMTKIFISLLVLKVLLQLYLSFRNQKHVEEHRKKVPEKFAEKITLEEHQKAADYTKEKTKAGHFFLILDTIFLLLWTVGGGINGLDQLLRGLELSPVMTGTLLFALF